MKKMLSMVYDSMMTLSMKGMGGVVKEAMES